MAVRLIAFYLPQYHPIPENDEWWGQGFSDWTNVVKARPLFGGHYQPHLPADLGFYDLRLPEAREAQAELAAAYGIHGFCYYHYWFNGRRLLERPLAEVLALKRPRLPFCVCWANESWSRRWDGGNHHVLMEQRHSREDDLDFINSLLPYFADERYIRVNGKPLLLVYRVGLFPEPERTAEIWRTAVRNAGLGDVYLVSVESFAHRADPKTIGFDAAVEFPGHNIRSTAVFRFPAGSTFRGRVFSYDIYIADMMARAEPGYKRFKAVMPSWDNTARHGQFAGVFLNSSPAKYQSWLKRTIECTTRRFEGDEQLVFINAWNEWAEGCHLEPDQQYGLQYLEATKAASTP